jgi:hypothetical protein
MSIETTAHINRIATGVPANDIHEAFVGFARTLLADPRTQPVFDRMATKSHIQHRFSVLAAAADTEGASVDAGRFYSRGAFPTTAQRMVLYEEHAPTLAMQTVAKPMTTASLVATFFRTPEALST